MQYAQYEMPMQYTARITAIADADYAVQRAYDAQRRQAKRERRYLLTQVPHLMGATNWTWKKGPITDEGFKTFVSSHGGWKIIVHEQKRDSAGCELWHGNEACGFFDTLGQAKQGAKKYGRGK